MAVQIYSSYVGTRAIKKAIADFPKYMRDKVFAEGAYFAARTVVRQARLTGAFTDRTGALRASIRIVGDRNTPGALAVAGGGAVNYGHFVEFGTKFAAPHPFMFPAFQQSRTRAIRNSQRAMRVQIDKFEQGRRGNRRTFRSF